jgi:hypothetical protein
MSAEQEWNQSMAIAISQISRTLQTLRETNVSDDELWFKNLLCGILDCALSDYQSVEAGIRESVSRAAWGRRNLLELRTITEYVLASAKNVADFRNDLAIDVKEFWDAMTAIQKDLHNKMLSMLVEHIDKAEGSERDLLKQAYETRSKRGPQTHSTEEEAAAYKKLMGDLGLKDNTQPKRVNEMAKLLDQKKEFDPAFKVSSKLVHRTALSIASSNIKGSLDELRPYISDQAAYDLLGIYGWINSYIKANGLRPPSE